MAAAHVIYRPSPVIENCSFVPSETAPTFINSGRTFIVASNSQFYYEASTISVEELNAGTYATITVKSGNVIESGQVVHLVRKATTWQHFSEPAVVFSERKFPINLLRKVFDGDQDRMPAALYLMKKFHAIRKTGGEGMAGFWLAVGVAYLDHLMLPCVHTTEFQDFCTQAAGTPLENYLGQLGEAKKAHRGNEALSQFHSDTDFSAALLSTIRSILLNYAIKKNQENEAAMICMVAGEESLSNVLQFQLDLAQDLIMLTTNALPIKIKTYDYFEIDKLETSFPCDESRPSNAFVYLFQKTNTFCILYTRGQCEVEGLGDDLRTRSMKKVTALSVRRLYYYPKVREEIKATGLESELAVVKRVVEMQTEVQAALHQYISACFNALEKKSMCEGAVFSTPRIIQATYAVKAKYQKHMQRIRNIGAPFDFVQKLSLLEVQDSGFSRLSGMKICTKCDTNPGVVMLKCSHYICRPCMEAHVNNFLGNRQPVVKVNGDPMEGFQCPVLVCTSNTPIEKAELQIALGDLEPLISIAEEVTLQMCCKRCQVIQASVDFPFVQYCGCRICDLCAIEFVFRGVCECGKFISPESRYALSAKSARCDGCSMQKSLVNDFTPIKCVDHKLCRDCLRRCIAGNKRCAQCHHMFSKEELQAAEDYMKVQCSLYCHEYILEKNLLSLSCGCRFCSNCAEMMFMKNHDMSKCYSCYKPLTQEERQRLEIIATESLVKYTIKRIAPKKINECAICNSFIAVMHELLLTCGHTYHRECLIDYADTEMSNINGGVIVCPTPTCRCEIDGGILERDILGSKFAKYSERLARAKFDLLQCPYCNNEFEVENPQDGIQCNCGMVFCKGCKQQWDAYHDSNVCKYNQLEDRIREAEQALGENAMIGQCPGCKAPYMKDAGCSKVKCTTPGCSEFLFCCSVWASSVSAHGPGWHRPDCSEYKPPTNAALSDQCIMCKQYNTLCTPPPRLRRPRRFMLDEY